ncbi:MAG TPA: BPSS1780 family membrane protein [Casimicrobiaceae bacterium]|nr:BPSS1780 family membrane protein [Casimicrobiaceae bacterium]
MTTPARAKDIVFTRYGARRGVAWLVEAYAMFRRAPLAWLALMMLYMVFLFFATTLPFAAQLFLLVRPVLAVGLLAAAWTQERGGRPRISQMFQGFRANLRALIALGALSIAGIMLAILATALFDGGVLLELIGRDPAGGDAGRIAVTDAVLKSGRLQASMLIAACLSLPTVLALWYAPALVVFQDAGPLTALGASFRAAFANWRPILIYGLSVALFGAVVPSLIINAVLTLAPNETSLLVLRFAFIAYWLMFSAILHISDYVSYRDVFHAGETLAPLPEREREPAS